MDRPSEATLWRSVQATLEELVIPVLGPGFERDSARQLVGLCRYAQATSGDDTAALAGLAEAVGAPEADDAAVQAAAADLLLAALRAEPGDSQADRAAQVRSALRARLAADIAEAAPLLETFSGHTPVEASEDAVEVPEQAALTAWFAEQFGGPVDLAISVMVGGHSRRMLNVRATVGGETHALIVRIEQGGLFGTEGTSEAKIMKAVSEAGFPAPAVRWIVTDPGVLGQPFFVMDRVPGTPVVDDPDLIARYVATLHTLHTLDPAIAQEGLGPVPATPEDGISAAIDRNLAVYRDSVTARIPLLEEAAEWLRANLRPTGPTAIVHGDPGPGNFLHQDGTITAFTDWELAHYGDQAEDWTYFGAIRARRMHDVDTWRRIFAEHADFDVSDRDWLAWEGFNQLKGACVNLTALRIFSAEVSTKPNLLAIGTAVHLRFLNRLVEIVEQLRVPEPAQAGGSTP